MNNPVVIMAGGEGKRLEPITKVLPKPLIPIGDIPIAQRIINRFLKFGCTDFYITINFKKDLIKAYFNHMKKTYDIKYIEEEKPLGTVGSLYMLKDKIKISFFLSNCDILIDGDYSEMLEFHKKNKNKITLVACSKILTLPYGVIKLDDKGFVKGIAEKPQYDYLVNTGMYILEPEILEDIPKNQFFHITDLIKIYVNRGERVGVFSIREDDWLDMGQFNELKNMMHMLGLEK
ncbi:nucleotidyltransferase family protein [Inediibacterium massiliense]|uniref:nucleotidyltransferase family protein n=1 Tax=Inediibacterium massiliense TaxID=1658111 RepID=UPI0006B57537|nr:sugar phosphate nucleotidyltransferase [Inediibacterium massiliense]